MELENIIKRPLLTEKMTALGELRQYAFAVDIRANKIQIRQAVEKHFNVKVLSVRTMRYKGKRKSQFTKRGKVEGRRPHWKKAVITLKEGEELDLLEAS